jgi:hypothetical protein
MSDPSLLSFLQDEGVDVNRFSENRSNLSITGTFISSDSNRREDSQLRLIFEDSHWRIDFFSRRETFQTLSFPLTNWSYSCTFLQFEPDILFVSSASISLALVAATIAVINKDDRIPAAALNPGKAGIFLISDRAFTRIRVLYTKDGKECPFIENLETFRVYGVSHGIYQISYAVIPYLEIREDSANLPPVPCMYPVDLPECVWEHDNLDGIVQGIRELEKRIQRAESDLDVAEETPLEITKQKILTDIAKLECEIDLRKEALLWELNQPNSELLEQIMRTVSPTYQIAGSIDFQQKYSIPGKVAAAQIMKLATGLRQ